MSRHPFDIRTMPLDGIRLIEASAGTGKTFSLAGLYLRLLLEKRVSVREILVITFTRAATKELRDRIRKRLADAARIARDPATADPGSPEDQLAKTLIEDSDEEDEAIARRLADAAHRIDEATITTIHGFSQRAATENAFDSALPFDRGEQVDDKAVREEAIEDAWRANVLGVDARPEFRDWWPSPDKLGEELSPLWSRPHADFAGPDDDAIATLAGQVRKEWQASGQRFAEALRACWADGALKKQDLKKAILELGDIEDALALLSERIESDRAIPTLPTWVAHLHDADTQFTKKQVERGEALFAQPLAKMLCELQPLARLSVLRKARRHIHDTASARKRERRQFSFADMIEALHGAVTEPETGQRLADALHRTWPWALVDEFQDTDPLQYEILQRVYAGRDTGGLILIGDPKQAIYGFRGGDVFAYLSAADAAGDNAYGLSHNFRSTEGVLDAIEALFRAPGDDAFLVEGIEFQSVKAGRTDERTLHLAGESVPPMTLWHLEPPKPNKPIAEAECRKACIAQIRRLLDPDAGAIKRKRSGSDAEPVDEPLRPRDVAVLVNTNAQASAMQRELSRVGIPAVCLHQASVFASVEAKDVLHVLKAAASPADEGLIRGALAGELLGFRLGDLIALETDEGRWQDQIDRFQTAHERWRDDSVLAMLQPLIQAGAERMLAYEDGERRVSNFLQLAELLAQAESETFGMAGLLRWLRQAIQEAGDNEVGDAEQLRLESDEALVRIATVHKAKGLEYPVVFVPFAPWMGTMGSPNNPPYKFHDAEHRAFIDVVGDEANQPQAIRETRAEGLRLLYVAVTRAELACFLPWGAANGTADSPLASLLHRDDGFNPDNWYGMSKQNVVTTESTRARLDELAQGASHAITAVPMTEVGATARRLAPPAEPTGTARTDLPAPREPWSVYSFTRLVRAAEPGPAAAGAADETEPEAAPDEQPPEQLPDLPGGTAFGSAVHGLLETADPAKWPAPGEPLPEIRHNQVAGMLRHHGIAVPPGEEGERVVAGTAELVRNALHTPLPEIGALAGIPETRRRNELEFVLRLNGRTLADLLDMLDEAGYAAELPRERQTYLLKGLMHGFIDLTVEHDGRFYVIDYKTNWLGPSVDDYTPEALDEAIRRRHYDLQYLIYVLGLHHYLARRLPDYDPAQHLGGVYYLFLRGMAPDAGERGIYFDRPDPALIQRLDGLLDTKGAAA